MPRFQSAFHTIAYRLWRLRRLWALTTLVGGLGALAAWAGAAPDSPFADPRLAGLLVALAGLYLAVVLVRFPHGCFEVLAAGPVIALVFAIAPWAERALRLVPDRVLPAIATATVLIGLALAMLLWLRLVQAAARLEQVPVRRRRLRLRGRTGLSPEDTAAALMYRPDTVVGSRTHGRVGADGFFDVTWLREQAVPGSYRIRPVVQTYRARILDQSAFSQTVMTLAERPDLPMLCATSRLYVSGRRNGGAVFRFSELVENASLGFVLRLWLMDYLADDFVARLDQAAGRAERALCTLPLDTPLTALSRLVAAVRPASRSG
jgi:hypothetical protein